MTAKFVIKKMETEEELRGKGYVHWRSWHEAYTGLVSQEYLDALTPEKCEEMAFRWPDNVLVAKDGDRVIGFVGYGARREEAPDTGEIIALYVLSEYYGKGVGLQLMEAALQELACFAYVSLWVLKENPRAIRFYEKCGFAPNGEEKALPVLAAVEIRMVRSVPRTEKEP